MKLTIRDKSILIGLFLSKFDVEGLNLLGFTGFTEAFNVLGFSIGAKPASLKNYRDEFDPLFPNPRKGWHKREIRSYCKAFYDEYQDWSLALFSELIKDIVYTQHEIQMVLEKATKQKQEGTFAKRLLTGQAAETYFKNIYPTIPVFQNREIEDTTKLGCGFDFKLYSQTSDDFLGVEVKGLNGLSGSISLTEKEYMVAKYLKANYFLFVVRNFIEKPNHIFYQNPLEAKLDFKKIETKIIQTNYTVHI